MVHARVARRAGTGRGSRRPRGRKDQESIDPADRGPHLRARSSIAPLEARATLRPRESMDRWRLKTGSSRDGSAPLVVVSDRGLGALNLPARLGHGSSRCLRPDCFVASGVTSASRGSSGGLVLGEELLKLVVAQVGARSSTAGIVSVCPSRPTGPRRRWPSAQEQAQSVGSRRLLPLKHRLCPAPGRGAAREFRKGVR